MSHENVVQLKIRLLEISPMIWRRILVSERTTLAQLRVIIQCVMGWENYHLHRFQIHGREYWEGGGSTPGENIQLAAFDFRVNEIFYYQYNFGDRWEHEIRVEKLLEGDPTKTYPVCIGGNRACPPEDCGGPWGYMELLRRLMDPLDPRRRKLMEWVGAGFDPARFHRRPTGRQLGRSYYQAGM